MMSNFESIKLEISQLNEQVHRLKRDVGTLKRHAHSADPEYQPDVNRHIRVIEEIVSSLNMAVGK